MKKNRIPQNVRESAQDKLIRKQRKSKAVQIGNNNKRFRRGRNKIVRYRRNGKRHASAHELTHAHSELARKNNIKIAKLQRQQVEDGILRTSYNAIPDTLSG